MSRPIPPSRKLSSYSAAAPAVRALRQGWGAPRQPTDNVARACCRRMPACLRGRLWWELGQQELLGCLAIHAPHQRRISLDSACASAGGCGGRLRPAVHVCTSCTTQRRPGPVTPDRAAGSKPARAGGPAPEGRAVPQAGRHACRGCSPAAQQLHHPARHPQPGWGRVQQWAAADPSRGDDHQHSAPGGARTGAGWPTVPGHTQGCWDAGCLVGHAQPAARP